MKKLCTLPILSVLSLSLMLGIPTLSLAKNKDTDQNKVKVNLYTETEDVFDKNVFEQVFTKKDVSFLKNSLNAKINYLKNSVKVIMKTKIKPSSEQGLTLYADGVPVEVNSDGSDEYFKNNVLTVFNMKATNLTLAAAARNFYSSDCHVALIQAGNGCTTVGSCQCNTSKTAAYCSGFVKDKNTGAKCSYTYHKHAGVVIPR